MAMDLFRNFAYGTIVVPPTPPNLGTTITVGAGHSARFPAPPFSASIWPIGLPADPTNAEIVRVTQIGGEQWTIVRAQEGSTARAILNTDQVAQALTAKSIADLKADCLAAAQAWVTAQGYAPQTYVDLQDNNVRSWASSQDQSILSQANATSAAGDNSIYNWTQTYFAQISWVNANFALISQIPAIPTFLPPRVQAGPSWPVIQINVDLYDLFSVTALAENTQFVAPIGTRFYEGQSLIIRIRDNGTARALTWAAQFQSQNAYATLPATTTPWRTLTLGFRWSGNYGWWALLALTQE